MKPVFDQDVMDLFEDYDCQKHVGILRCVVNHHDPMWENRDQYGEMVTVLGEILNMPGHVVFIDQKGKTHSGWHDCNFLLVNEHYFYEEVDGKSVPRLVTPEIDAQWKAEADQYKLDHPEGHNCSICSDEDE